MRRSDYRAAVREQLPERAFLRRGTESLFVTNAALFGAVPEEALRKAGFSAVTENKIPRIDPGEELIFELERAYIAPPDRLSAELYRFRLTEQPDLALFSACCRAVDAGKWDESVEKALRIRAAEACRTGRGGGLYACACALALLRQST